MPRFSPAQPRRAETRRSAGKAAASEEARRTLRYVEPLSDARTKLADCFSILLEFPCQPVDNHTRHLRDRLRRVL